MVATKKGNKKAVRVHKKIAQIQESLQKLYLPFPGTGNIMVTETKKGGCSMELNNKRLADLDDLIFAGETCGCSER